MTFLVETVLQRYSTEKAKGNFPRLFSSLFASTINNFLVIALPHVNVLIDHLFISTELHFTNSSSQDTDIYLCYFIFCTF